MITKTHLAKKVTEKAGLLPFDAQQFFEVFLTRLKSRIKAGEIIGSDFIGYFTLRSCVLQYKSGISSSSELKEISATMILFSEENDFRKDNRNMLFFSIPETTGNTDDEYTSHFKLGISKPLLSDVKYASEGFSDFTLNSEIVENFKSKADILLNTFNKIEKVPDEEVIIFETQEESPDSIVFQEQGKDQNQETGLTALEQNSLEEEKPNDTFSGLPWDFGRKFFEKRIDYPEQDRIEDHEREKEADDAFKSISNGEIIEETVREELSGMSFTDDTGEIVKHIEDTEEKIKAPGSDDYPAIEEIENKRYERVRTFIPGDMRNKKAEDDDLPVPLKKEDVNNDAQSEFTEEFIPVKSKSETYHLIDVKKQKKRKKIFRFAKDSLDYNESLSYSKTFRRKFRVLPFAISTVVLIIIVGLVYIFLEKDSILTSEPKNIFVKVTPPPYVNVIERDYEFAVSFPYSKSETNMHISGIDPAVFKEGIKIIEQKPVPVEPKKELKEEPKTDVQPQEKKEIVSSEKNKNITRYKDYYIVQVSAYRSYAAADEEAEKFRDLGYNAFIEIAEIPDKGTWYRIKVGDFTSIKHAEDFLIKYRNQ